MTQTDHRGPSAVAPRAGNGTRQPAVRAGKRRRAWWLLGIAAVIVAFLIYQVPPYASMDPSQSRIPLQFPAHYWLIVGHVLFGSIAMLTLILQLWPWIRRRHPAVHRWSGRAYVFAGAIPSGLFAVAMLPVSYPAGRTGVAMSAVLWMATAVLGWVKLRQGRYAVHRRLMLYSFAIVWGQVIWGFAIGMPFALGWIPFTGDFDHIVEAARWVGWVGNLVLVQWWLDRTRGRDLGLVTPTAA